MWIFAVFLAIPLVEIGLFVSIGGLLGVWLTLAFVFGSAMLGVFILRKNAARPRGRQGNLLMQIAGSGFAVLAAMLLILPGFLTSLIGAMLLIPFVQRLVIAVVGQRLAARGFVFETASRQAGRPQDDVIDGEFSVVPEPRDTSLPPSGWTRH